MDIIGKRYWYFALSLLLIVPGMILLAVKGLPLAIDFTGGSMLEVSFESGKAPAAADVVAMYADLGIKDVQVQTSGDNILIIRSPFLADELSAKVVPAMESTFNDKVTVRQYDSVGPTVGKEVAGRAAGAVALSAIIVVLFITYSFRGVEHAFRYGVCAIAALLHDILVAISLITFGAHYWGWQVDSLCLTALLTVIGFSTQDTIVVFDRIRENSRIYRKLPFEKLVNHSVVQTLQRSINTQLMTVEFMLLALVLFGGVTLRQFSLILLVGLLSGSYSSIFTAAPVLVVWEQKEWRTWFKRGPKTTQTA
jgi:preprotein translocase subunit SecF